MIVVGDAHSQRSQGLEGPRIKSAGSVSRVEFCTKEIPRLIKTRYVEGKPSQQRKYGILDELGYAFERVKRLSRRASTLG
eukprot:528296-Pyramimonas_sp.AAC.1